MLTPTPFAFPRPDFNDLWKFNTGTNDFSQITPANTPPPARFGHGAAAFPNQLVVAGGIGSRGMLDDLYTFDVETLLWKKWVSDLFSGAAGNVGGTLAAFETDGVEKAYLFGGKIESTPGHYVPTDGTLWEYNFATNEWRSGLQDPFGSRTDHSGGAVDNRACYFFGRDGDGNPRTDVSCFDINTGDWEQQAQDESDLPPWRQNAAGTLFKILAENAGIFLGGRGATRGNAELRDAWLFNFDTNTWTRLADMPAALSHSAAAAFTDASGMTKILVYGGRRDDQLVGDAFLYDMASNTWQVLDLGPNNPGPLVGHSLVTVDNTVHLFGGMRQDGGNVTARVARGTLNVTGDPKSNSIRIEPGAGGAGSYRITGFNGTTVNDQAAVELAGVTRGMKIKMNAGDDLVLLDGSTTAMVVPGSLQVDTGPGNDTLRLDPLTVTGKTKINTGPGTAIVDIIDAILTGDFSLITGNEEDQVTIDGSKFRGKVTLRTLGGADDVIVTNSAFQGATRLDGGTDTDSLDAGLQTTPNANDNMFAVPPVLFGFEDMLS